MALTGIALSSKLDFFLNQIQPTGSPVPLANLPEGENKQDPADTLSGCHTAMMIMTNQTGPTIYSSLAGNVLSVQLYGHIINLRIFCICN